jgi:uncharacterized protein (DUF2147 family)
MICRGGLILLKHQFSSGKSGDITGSLTRQEVTMKKSLLIFTLALVLALAGSAFGDDGSAVLGNWTTDGGKATVNIYKCGGKFCGSMIGLKEPYEADGSEKLDKNNTDPAKQKRKLIGINLVWGFTYDGDNKYTGGRIYDPENGKTYYCKMTLEGNTLKVRGSLSSVGILGRTTTWTR